MKSEGLFVNGAWACSEDCAKNISDDQVNDPFIEDKQENIEKGKEEVKDRSSDNENIDDDEDGYEYDDNFIGIDPITGDPITRNNE